MKRLILFCFICLPMAVGVLPWGDGQALAQNGPALDRNAAAKMEQMRERAERVQQRRKARVSHADRQAVADRTRTDREKAAPDKPAPAKARKGVAQ